MGIRTFAELSIVQSMEDLWDNDHRNEGLEFFNGGGFRLYASIAGMDPFRQAKLRGLIVGMLQKTPGAISKSSGMPSGQKRISRSL